MCCTDAEQDVLCRNIREHIDRDFPGRGGLRQLAEKMGLPTRTLSQWLKGNKTPSDIDLYNLACIFNITPQELCGLPKRRFQRHPEPVAQGQIYACDTMIMMAKAQKNALMQEDAATEWEQITESLGYIINQVNARLYKGK